MNRDKPKAMDIGGGNLIEITGKVGKPGGWGLIWTHPRRDNGNECEGCLSWDPADAKHWNLISQEPLTLSPSLQCEACGAHGWIEQGRWKSA